MMTSKSCTHSGRVTESTWHPCTLLAVVSPCEEMAEVWLSCQLSKLVLPCGGGDRKMNPPTVPRRISSKYVFLLIQLNMFCSFTL